MAHELIAHQDVGSTFSGVYYVESAYIKKTVQNKDYTDMTLRDRSGARPVKFWGTVKGLSKGGFVHVAAAVEDYQGNPSIIARNVEVEDAPSDLSEYIPAYENAGVLADEFDALRKTLGELEVTTGDETCSMLVDEVYRSAPFFDKFIRCPGSDGPSYGKTGGLLASVVRVGRHALESAQFYNTTDEEKAILLAASLLCRIGGTDAYDFQDCVPTMTKRGLLLGVPNLTMTRASSALRRVVTSAKAEGKSVSQDTILRLLHAIVAANQTCGVEPMTKEAMVLSGVVKMDAELVDSLDFIASDVNQQEEFTAFDPRTRRHYYRGA